MATNEWKEFFIDLFSGAFAGVTMVISAHPLDTIKVRMQVYPSSQSMIKILKDIYVREGFISYYKGVTAPITFSLPVSSSVFASYELYMRYFKVDDRDEFIINHWLMAGCFAGFVQSFVVCPTELLKCVLQAQYEYLPKQFNSPYQCMKSVLKEEGLRGMFKGLQTTIIRDIPQYALFFSTFESCKYFCLKYRETQELNLFENLVAGALAGFLSICASYPQDLIKTKIQCEVVIPQHLRIYSPTYCDGGNSQCAQLIYKTAGYKGFWAGFNSAAAFYIVQCSVQFLTFEQTKNYLSHLVYPNKY